MGVTLNGKPILPDRWRIEDVSGPNHTIGKALLVLARRDEVIAGENVVVVTARDAAGNPLEQTNTSLTYTLPALTPISGGPVALATAQTGAR